MGRAEAEKGGQGRKEREKSASSEMNTFIFIYFCLLQMKVFGGYFSQLIR